MLIQLSTACIFWWGGRVFWFQLASWNVWSCVWKFRKCLLLCRSLSMFSWRLRFRLGPSIVRFFTLYRVPIANSQDGLFYWETFIEKSPNVCLRNWRFFLVDQCWDWVHRVLTHLLGTESFCSRKLGLSLCYFLCMGVYGGIMRIIVVVRACKPTIVKFSYKSVNPRNGRFLKKPICGKTE